MRRPKVKHDLPINTSTAMALAKGRVTAITLPVDTAMFYNEYSQGNGVWVSQTEGETFIKDLSVSDMWIRLDHYNYMYGPYRKGETVYCREAFKEGRKQARFWLKITNVAIRRLQDMTEEDALANGISRGVANPLSVYKSIWNREQEIKWKENPWVWVLTVERLKNNG